MLYSVVTNFAFIKICWVSGFTFHLWERTFVNGFVELSADMLWVWVSLHGFIVGEQKVVVPGSAFVKRGLRHHLRWSVVHYWVILRLGMVSGPILVDHRCMNLVVYGAISPNPTIRTTASSEIVVSLFFSFLARVVVGVGSLFIILLIVNSHMATSR